MTCKSDDSRPSRRRIEYPSSARLWRVQHFSTDLGGGKAIQILGAQAGDRSGASLETAAWDTIAGMIHEILNLALSRYVMYACIRVKLGNESIIFVGAGARSIDSGPK